MPNSLDVKHLIAEVKKRPALWDARLPEYKERTHTARLWQEISQAMYCDVEQCKRKWKNLRDAYRAEVRRTERRIQSLKLEGHAHPQVSESKWVYFQAMNFMKRKRNSSFTENASPNGCCSNDSYEAHITEEEDGDRIIDMDCSSHIKMEQLSTTDDETDNNKQHVSMDCVDIIPPSSFYYDDEEANDRLFEQFKSVATPQAARRVSDTLSKGIELDIISSSPAHASNIFSNSTTAADVTTTTTTTPTPTEQQQEPNTSSSRSRSSSESKGSQRAEDQVHFLEDLEREEQKLMLSTKREISRASNVAHLGDSDYNFLVSFLPQLKRLHPLQNLRFRTKMSELMLNIMAQPTTTTTTTAQMTTTPTTTIMPVNNTINISTSATPPCQEEISMDCTTRTTTAIE